MSTQNSKAAWEKIRNNERLWRWVILTLISRAVINHSYHQLDKRRHSELHSMIIQYTKINHYNFGDYLVNLVKTSKDALLENEHFQWIADTEPLKSTWCLTLLIRRNYFITDTISMNHKEQLIQITSIFDMMVTTLQDKKQLMEELKRLWFHESREWSWGWLSKTDKTQCEAVWDYFCNHQLALPMLSPITKQEKYYAIISSFQCLQAPDRNSKAYTLSKIKNAWYRKHYRHKQKNRKAYNFVMDNGIQDKLKEISKLEGKDRNNIVEELITERFETLMNSSNITNA